MSASKCWQQHARAVAEAEELGYDLDFHADRYVDVVIPPPHTQAQPGTDTRRRLKRGFRRTTKR